MSSMTVDMPKWKGILVLITLFFSNIIIVADYVLGPTVATLYQLFPDSVGAVNFVVTGPYLVAVFATPIAGKLCSKLTTRTVFLIGCISAAVGCVFIMLFQNAYWMASMRFFFGIGYAFVQVSGITIINQLYFGKKQLPTMIGIYNASIPAVGIALGIVAGNLAVISITATYKAYWVLILLVAMAVILIPKIKVDLNKSQEETVEAVPESGVKAKLGGKFWINVLNVVLFNLAYCIVINFLSLYVAENELGTAAMVGYASSLKSAVSFLGGLAFGVIFSKLGRKVLPLAYGLAIISFVLLYFFPSTLLCYISIAWLCACYLTSYSGALTYLPMIVAKSRLSDAISYVSAGVLLASFISSYVVTGFQSIIHGNFTQTLFVPLILCIAVTVIQIFITIERKKNDAAEETVNN